MATARTIAPQRATLAAAPRALLTVMEAAGELRVSKTTLLRLVSGDIPNQPPLPCVRMGRRLLIRRDSLERFILQAEVNSAA